MSTPNATKQPFPKDLLPDPMSKACADFLTEHWQTASFFLFVYLLAADRDETSRDAARTVLRSDHPQDVKDSILAKLQERHGAIGTLVTREQLLMQLMLSKIVDSYLCYLSELLTLVFVAKPETLKSKEQITIDDILQFNDMKDVVLHLAEKKVHELSYQGMRKLAAYLKKKIGLDVLIDANDLDRLIQIIELRNLIAHNRGIANKIFLKRLPNYPIKEGEVIRLDTEATMKDVDFLASAVCDLERRAAQKFGFPQPVESKKHVDQFNGLSKVLDMFEGAVNKLRSQQT
ncbi:Uncharacterized protein OS=Bradyrhizobium sp. (strain ORS278) GN=BRADO3599 PE=4 SV=1 [Gemmata massiliana]|uniref:RiboL-PSP-HEPN domain-containing protein n=1 Tax=Gemmata massiliana TaxID=1210884 RepID=A0A6P2CR96_9BACT|nr:hypothetical protein [Gemmata massiliana]VTR91501.1 Uncharacterized protein OS=Bradyrhizobium sp. (strain ORS278) GN=BRADO3599 PE=4 SV=1 [Gemmata massiliana]